MVNKDVRKSLAHNKGNENLILGWNDSSPHNTRTHMYVRSEI